MTHAQRIMNMREITSMLTADQLFKLGQQAARRGYETLQDYAAAVLREAASRHSEKMEKKEKVKAAADAFAQG